MMLEYERERERERERKRERGRFFSSSSLSFFAALPFSKFFPNGPPSSLCSIFSFLPLLFRSERRMPPEIRVFSPRLILCALIVEQICQLASIVYARSGWRVTHSRQEIQRTLSGYPSPLGRSWMGSLSPGSKNKAWVSSRIYTQMRVCPLL